MKKQWIAGLALTAGLTLSAFIGGEEASAKVVWDGAEIGTGQTGKLAFNKDTKIYKKNVDGSFTSMVSKKGSFWRVYGTEKTATGTIYNMSGGYRVNASNLTTYKAVPSYIQDQVKLTVTTHTLLKEDLAYEQADIQYLTLNNLSNGTLQRQINSYLKSVATQAVSEYAQLKKERAEEVLYYENEGGYGNFVVPPRWKTLTMSLDYNSKGYITIGFEDDAYAGGAHGYGSYTAITYNLETAKQVSIGDFVTTQAQRTKFNQYVYQRMLVENNKQSGAFNVDEYTRVDFKTPFYLTDDSIVLVYNPYDLGNYASGLRQIYVPFKAFQ